MSDIDDYVQVGIEIVREAGGLLLGRIHTDLEVSHKGIVNLVTDVDLAAENLIVERLQSHFPAHSILAEERHSETRDGDVKWIIDPLDGTTNFAHGYPVFSVSIGLEVAGVVEWGAVFDPVRDELYTARRGGGADCNRAALRVSKVPSLGASLLATGFPYDIRSSRLNNLDNFCAFALRSHGIRRSGSAALDLCHVAAGRLDGFWELKLNPWDCAAGYLMVREAGGRVTNFRGDRGSIYEREVIASNGLIHDEMISVIRNLRGVMQLRDKISKDLLSAMKLKEAERVSVLRMMKAAVRNKEIDLRRELQDPEVMQVLMTMIRQRRDSIEQFTKGGRLDLSEKEAAEIKVIEQYMPAAVTEEEIKSVVESVIAETGAKTAADMGKVMKACMAHFAGRPIEGRKVNELVKEKLTNQ